MQFIKKIREDLGLNPYQMQKQMGLAATHTYLAFEGTKESLNAIKLVKLWRLSGLDGNKFLELIENEVLNNKRGKKPLSTKKR
jgi:hypothetical protein